jgi:hypothetical protein
MKEKEISRDICVFSFAAAVPWEPHSPLLLCRSRPALCSDGGWAGRAKDICLDEYEGARR